jgi:protein-tyrosine phosphatase
MASWVTRLKSQIAGRGKPAEPAIEPDYRILFVCMGNICRSPTVEAVFREVVRRDLPEYLIEIDSAGTHAYHVGHAPDPRAQRAAERRGLDLSALRARRIQAEDFSRFDIVLGMDPLNIAVMEEHCPAEHRSRIRLLMEFAPAIGREDVPDPYYGGSNGFEYVLDLAEEASRGLIAFLRSELSKP